MGRFGILFLSTLMILIGCSSTAKLSRSEMSPLEKLQEEIVYLISDPNLQNAQAGIVIESLTDGKTIFRLNEHKLFIPASNMKLFTTAAALTNLNPDFRYRTSFYTNGSVQDHTLNGDLIIRGSGDPSISGRFRENDLFACFKDWADSLRRKDILNISGQVIGDESSFSGPKVRRGWQWDDMPYYYSAAISALSFNDNCIDFEIFPTKQVSDSVILKINPPTDYATIINQARTIHADSLSSFNIDRELGKNIIRLLGGIPAGSAKITESITIENPAQFYLHVLYHFWKKEGINLQGNYQTISERSAHNFELLKHLFTHASSALADLIKVVNKNSNNFFAEQLLSTLAAQKYKVGSQEKGLDFMSNWTSSIGIAPAEFHMADGSGLSRRNLVSPFSIATLLRYMYRHPNFQYYFDSLPIAGVDGTIKGRMQQTRAQGNVRAKTGFIGNTRCLSGYLNDAAGKPYLFVIMINNYLVPTPYANNLQDKICILLSNFKED